MSSPRERRLRLADLELCVFEWGDARARPVLLLHATGFHGRCWDAIAEVLAEDFRVIAPDMRGHGRSGRLTPYTWRSFGEDLGGLLAALELADVIGVGHSMGGHCLTQAAARHPGVFTRLVLVDPVIFSPQSYASGESTHAAHGSRPEDLPVARRRAHWANWQEMVERFRDRLPFSRWQPRILDDYCRHGLLPDGSGGYELACPPLVEASVYMGNTKTDVHAVLGGVTSPVLVLRGHQAEPGDDLQMEFSNSPTWPGLAAAFARGRDVYLPALSHFIPMESPETIVAAVRAPETLR